MQTREYWLGRRFYDKQRYPFGFSRAGDFSIGQSKLLEEHGELIKALLEGQVSNPTIEDLQLKESIENNDSVNAGELGRTWLKYTSVKREIVTVSASSSETVNQDDLEWVDDSAD